MLPGYVVYIAGAIGLVGIVPYVWDTLRGETFPHRVTWALWGFIPLVTFVVQLHAQVGVQKVMTLAYVIAPAAVVTSSFAARRGSWAVTPFDWACAGVSLGGLAVFVLTGSGDPTIALLVAADMCAAVPTIRKSFRAPETETWTAFVGGTLSSGLTLLTVTHWTFPTYALPAYIATQSLAEVVLIVGRIGPRLQARSSAGRDTSE